jgi:quercetin dioxygenase-like cupin family protein
MRMIYKAGRNEKLHCKKLLQTCKKSSLPDIFIVNAIVFKQWGFEYPIAYVMDTNHSAWVLHINPNAETSFHCHSRKISIIKVLEGSILVRTNAAWNPIMVYEGDDIVFGKKVFHSEQAGPNGAVLLQLETSLDKTDAVRFKDKTGKVGLPYEGKCKVIFLE